MKRTAKLTLQVIATLTLGTLAACLVSYILYFLHIANLDPALLTIAACIIGAVLTFRQK